MNSTYPYSCYDGAGLSLNSVTPDYWDTRTATRDTTLTSAVLTLFFILVGVPSNVLIIVSILRRKLYRQPTYILLLNMAIADLLMCALFMPFTVVAGFAGEFIFGDTDIKRCRVCKLSGTLFAIFGLFTLHVLALISLDRFLFIKCPLKYHVIVTLKRCCVTCACVWILCILLSVPPLFGFGDYIFGLRVSACVINLEFENSNTNNLYYGIFLMLEIFIPLAILFGTNIWIVLIVQKHMRRLYIVRRQKGESKSVWGNKVRSVLSNSKELHNQLQLVKVFGLILGANILTWIPYIFRVIGHLIFGSISSRWFLLFTYISITSFAVLHPVIQASHIPEFRRYLVAFVKKAVCCHYKRKSSGAALSHSNVSTEPHTSWYSLDCLDLCNAALVLAGNESGLE